MTVRPVAALVSVACALLSCAASPRVHPRAAEEIVRGYGYLGAGDLERAEVAFAHALEFNDDIPEAQNGMGLVARRRDDLGGARRRFERAVKLAPDFAEGRVNLGELDLTEGRERAAEASFRAALRIDPDLAVARLDLARALLHRGRREPAERERLWARARTEYLHLLESRPKTPEAHHDLGFMDYETGAFARAEVAFSRAAELAPGYLEALHGTCIARVRLGRCDDAAKACRACLAVAPGAEACAKSLRGALACASASAR